MNKKQIQIVIAVAIAVIVLSLIVVTVIKNNTKTPELMPVESSDTLNAETNQSKDIEADNKNPLDVEIEINIEPNLDEQIKEIQESNPDKTEDEIREILTEELSPETADELTRLTQELYESLSDDYLLVDYDEETGAKTYEDSDGNIIYVMPTDDLEEDLDNDAPVEEVTDGSDYFPGNEWLDPQINTGFDDHSSDEGKKSDDIGLH